MTIEIYNDTGIDNIDVIVLSGTTISTISVGNGKAEEIDINYSESFTIKKENPWSDIRGAKKMLMILLAFSFVFGNMLDSDNMPFSIFSCFNSNDIIKKKIVYIKEMISTVQEEIVTWYKVAIMQSMLVTGAIIAVAIISCIAIIGAIGKLLTFIILVSTLLFAIVLEKKLLKKIMTVKRNLFDMIN